jgi:uncharacterized protein involved in exopolysaccharide biosynthesis
MTPPVAPRRRGRCVRGERLSRFELARYPPKTLVIDTQNHTIPQSNATPDTRRGPEYTNPHGELGDVGRKLLRSWWIIVLCGLIALAVGLGVSSRTPTTYQATAYVLLNENNFQQAVTGGSAQVNTQTAEATTIAMLTPQREAQAAQAAGLRPSDNYGVSINAASNSNVLNVNGSTADPRMAAALADQAAQQLVDAVKQANANSLSGARAAVQSQFRAAKPSQKRPLASELNSFTTLEALADQSIEIVQPALVPGVPSGHSHLRDGGIALVLGLILGCALAVLRPDRRGVRGA